MINEQIFDLLNIQLKKMFYLSAGPCDRIFVIISGLVVTLSSDSPPRSVKP
jgi:hypothetical protein